MNVGQLEGNDLINRCQSTYIAKPTSRACNLSRIIYH